MKTLKIFLMLVVVGGLVYVGVHFGRPYFGGGGGPALAKSLPADTLGWVSIQDVDSLAVGLGGKDSLKQLFELFGEQPDFGEFLKKYLGEKLDDKTSAEFYKWLTDVKSVDILFEGVGIHQGQPLPELVVMFELPTKGAVSKTTKKLAKMFSEKSKYEGAPVYGMTKELAEEMDGAVPCMAAYEKRLLFSLDKKTLEGSLDMLRGGSKKPLAKSKSYRRLTKGSGSEGASVWIGAALVDKMLDLAPKDEQAEARSTMRATGLDAIEGLWLTGDAAKGKTLLRLGMKEGSKLAKTFALGATDRNFASLAPDDSWFVGSVSIEDGAALWDRLDKYLSDTLQATGAVGSESEYRQGMDGMKQGLGVGPKDVLSILSDIGVCMGGKLSMPTFSVLVRVTDKGKAEAMLADIGKRMGGGQGAPAGSASVKGKSIQTLGGFLSYVVVDDVICFGAGPAGVTSVVEAQAAGKVVAKTSGYKSVAKRLPKKSALRLYYNVGGLVEAMGEQAGPMGEAIKKKKATRDAMVWGMTLRADKGVFELASAQPPASVVGDLFSKGMVDALRKARGKAVVINDRNNLKQLSIGLMMFCNDQDNRFPKDLGEIWEYVGSGKAFRCPASRRPQPRNAKAVASGDCDYVYLKPAVRADQVRRTAEEPIMMTRPGLLADNMVNVAYADGHVTSHSTKALPQRVRLALEKHHGRSWLIKLRARK